MLLEQVLYPYRGTDQTVSLMVHVAISAQQDSAYKKLADNIVQGINPKDYVSEYIAIRNWVLSNIRYTRDSIMTEQVKTLSYLLHARAMDCDCMTTLIAALVMQVGGVAAFVRGARSVDETGRPCYEHVWVEAMEPRLHAWIVLDPVAGQDTKSMLQRMTYKKRTVIE